MTEADWVGCDNPRAMIRHLRGRPSGRKLRLFACACCRQIWHLLNDPRSREVVETAEKFADELVPIHTLARAGPGAAAVVRFAIPYTKAWAAACAADTAGRLDWSPNEVAESTADFASWHADTARRTKAGRAAREAKRAASRAQADLLRDIIGSPFRPVNLDPAWLLWRDDTILRLAQAIYDERRFADLPVLADALEEAGCADPDILGHCRGPGLHVRGCWVLDLLLGNE